MKSKYFMINFIITLCMITTGYSNSTFAFDISQQLKYESYCNLSSNEFNYSLTLNIDYFQEISEDIFLEGDLIVRASNKKYSQPFIIWPNEIYISTYNIIQNLDLRAGKIITRWGSADLFSPLDNFNPMSPGISLTKDQNQRKLGALGLNATYYISDVTYLQTVLMPQLETTPYPDQYLKDSYLVQYQPIYQFQGLNINTVELAYQSTENVIWGLRLNHSFPSFDAGISYYQGYYMDPFPVSQSTTPNSAGTTLEMTLGYPAKQVWGLDFQGDFPGVEGATLRGDLAYIIPESWEFQNNQILENPYFQGVISADYTTNSNLYLNAGFFYGLPFERGNNCSPYFYLNCNQEIKNSDLKPFYTGVFSLSDMSMINVVGLDYQISERVSASFTYVSLMGDSKSKLGILESSKGFSFSLEWLF